jgi:hypothetical protein
MAQECSQVIVSRTIRGPFRMLFELIATPERCARHSQRLWSAYFETGLSTVSKISPNCYEQRIEGWAEHHPLICEMNTYSAVVLYEEMGCREVRVRRTGCVSQGMQACISRVSWAV